MTIYQVTNECVGCGGCLAGYDGDLSKCCPTKAIALKVGRAEIDPAKCKGCGWCATICALGAIKKVTDR